MNNQSPEYPIIQHTMHWVRSFVIGLNLCPFAKGPVNKGQLKIQVCNSTKKADILKALLQEVQWLDQNQQLETTLLVIPEALGDFFDYLDFLETAEIFLEDQGYHGIYQLASFHPHYFFADSNPDDVANFTNRSPYPMLHLLREEQLEKAIETYGDTSQIPEKNVALLRSLGQAEIEKIITEM